MIWRHHLVTYGKHTNRAAPIGNGHDSSPKGTRYQDVVIYLQIIEFHQECMQGIGLMSTDSLVTETEYLLVYLTGIGP